MTTLGTVASVDAVALGAELAVTAYSGDTTLTVTDSSDFFQSGGYLLVGGGAYKFVAVDGVNDIITLAAPLAATPPFLVIDNGDGTLTLEPTVPVVDNGDGTVTATFDDASVSVSGGVVTLDNRAIIVDAGESVTIWDSVANKLAVEIRAWVMEQAEDNTGDALSARVDPGAFPYLPLGPRDLTSGQGEGVTLEDRDGTFWVTAISGRASTYAPDFLATAPAPSDGLPPSSSPVPTVTGGIGSLFIDWTPITNTTLVTYDVHISLTSGFTPSPTDLVISTTGSSALCTALADGTPLTSVNTYYVVLVAHDTDGSATPSTEVSGTPRTASGPDIDVNYVYAGTVLANQINAGIVTSPLVLGSSMKTAVVGARVEQDAAGLRIYAPDGTLVANFGSDGSGYVSGNVDAGTLTVEGPSTFLGPVELANGVVQTIDSSFVPGANAPSCSCSWYGNGNRGGFGGQPAEWTILNYSAAASQMYAYISHAFSGGKSLQVWTIDNTGAATALVASHTVSSKYQAIGAGVIGTTHWFYLTDGAGNASWFNSATAAITVVDTTSAYQDWAAGTSDGTNLWTVNASGTNILVKKWDPTNLSAPLSTTTITKPTGFSAVWGIYVGSGDFGTAQIGLSIETTDTHGNINARQYLWYGFGGTAQPNNTFNAAIAASNSNLAYDGTRFWGSGFFNIVRYEGGTHKLSGPTATWYSTYTWRNDASGYETIMSSTPRAFTMQSRSIVTMNGMTVPSGADHLGFYLGTSTSRTAQWLQGESTGPSLVLSPDATQDLVLSGTNPPATGSFPTSAPAAIVSGSTDANGALIKLYGDGTYRLAGTNLDDVAWTSLGNTAKYRVRNGFVCVYVNNSSFTIATATKTVISTSTIPAAYRPSSPVYSGAYFSGQVGLVEVDSDGNLYGTQNSGGSTSNVSGYVSYPIGL